MGGAVRQQRQFVLVGRPLAAVLALAAFGVLQLVRPSDDVARFLVVCAVFAAVTIPLSWLAARRWPIEDVTRAVLVTDIVMVAAFVWALDRESLLVVVFLAPIAFAALMFGPRVTLLLGALAFAAAVVVALLRDFELVGTVANLVVLAALTGIVAVLSRDVQEAQRQLELDAAALRIAERFRETLDLENVLANALEELGNATACARVRLRLAPGPDGSTALYEWTRPGEKQVPDVLPPLGSHVLERREPLIVDTEQTEDVEFREYMRRFDARSFLGYPIMWDNATIAAVGLFDDRPRTWKRSLALLDRVVPQLAAALVQADLFQRQQETAALREELVANVSHELRTPLTATIGFLKTLEREDVNLDPQQRREFLAVSRREAERLARLVSDLLHLTRLERGSITIVREHTSIAAIVARAARDVERPEGRDVRVTVPDDLVASVDGDRLLQVLSNLISNGLRHGAGDVTVVAANSGGALRITVSDEGSGVPPEHVETMFEPFARWSRHRDSSGLGLAIARRIVEAHGGTLEYRAPRDGAPHAFVVEVPA